jgi:hypothetical protein
VTTPTRSTADFVVRTLTISVAVLIVASGLCLILVELLAPGEHDTAEAVRGVSDIINTVVGALIGYLAGLARGARKDDPPA